MKDLIQDYLNGMPIKDIKDKYGIKGDGTIYYHLKKAGISNRGKTVHYDNPFIIESPERDYWLGWIFSDGHIHKSGNTAWLTLACLDDDILEKFKKFCGDRATFTRFTYTTPVSKEKKTMGRVTVYSIELVKWFYEKYGLSNKKAATLNPNIPINWNLLRGALDGDGSFKKGVVLTSKSKDWIDKIKSFYNSYNIRYTCVQDSAYRLAVYNKRDIKRIYNYLYKDATLFLERKRRDLSRLAGE